MNALSAVFWDVDGTIADTELCGHRVAFNFAFKDFGLDWYWDEKKYIELLKLYLLTQHPTWLFDIYKGIEVKN